MDDDVHLSENFSLAELTSSTIGSRLGISNVPSDLQIATLQSLVTTLLEPVRAELGVPLHVDSGFRCPQLNAAVGGAQDSAHLDGRAADVIPIGFPLREAFDEIRASGLPFDQIIIEAGTWIHLAIAGAGLHPRREALIATRVDGQRWHYLPA